MVKIFRTMFGVNQCYAPIKGNKRCDNIIAKTSSIHCEQHRKESSKLYSKYKAFSEKAKTLSLDEVDSFSSYKEKVNYLMKCYSIFRETYNLRMEFKTRYITPGYSDDGHEHQFALNKNKMEQCEERLEKLYEEILKRKEVIMEVEIKTSYTKDDVDENFIEEIRSFKKKKKEDEKETNVAIANYIKENKDLLKDKRRKVDEIEKYFSAYRTRVSKYFNNFVMASLFLICFNLDCKDRVRNGRGLPPLTRVFKLSTKTDLCPLLMNFHPSYLEVIHYSVVEYTKLNDITLDLLVEVWKSKDFRPETHSLYVSLSEETGLSLGINQNY